MPLGAFAAHSAGTAAAEGLHLDWLNTSINPARNFYEYANGGWQKANPMPAAYSRWGTFSILAKQNQETIRQILEDAGKNTHAKPGTTAQKVGDFYASGMDESAVNKAGVTPLAPEFERIAAISNPGELQSAIAHLQMIGVDAVFNFGSMQDFKDSSKMIGGAFQGGLGLPDRDYYLKDDAKFKQIRAAYVTHVANMLELLGDSKDKAAAEAKVVMGIETRFAKTSMSRVDQRTPSNIYHVMTLKQLDGLTPNISWQTYLADIGLPKVESINVGMPDFFKAISADLKSTSLDDWKTYLRWHLIDAFAPYLSQPFVDENFKMRTALTGAKENLPRWQRVVSAENRALGFAIGKLYVEEKFPPSSKKAVLNILHGIRGALKNDLKTLAWMTPATRVAAIKKLDMMGERIGYPDKWRDYSKLSIDRGPYVLNVMHANEFLNRRDLNKIGKPVDKAEWYMTPQTVNAYYDPSMNNINFPAGILQPPFFDPKAPAAVNYGALGFVMGHEMTHGFDDQGAQFDGHGNLKDWWTDQDKKKFKTATDCISDHFSQYTVDGDLHVQGHLVTGEATADFGGLTLAWRAFHASPAYKHAKTIDGVTPDQQFFLGAAHVWAMNIRPEESRRLVTIDPHPPGVYRVNGTVANMPQFQKAFGIPDGSPMVNKDRCVIW
ncbi:MAG TPA: M13 family metallopeptidase [Gammaproteobacteria bacterium]|nr:M13 family metallopeptidase [Gammaproteobacteria bacterium]